MEKIIDYLKQLELSELEAKLYLTLLQAGPITVRELAANVDVKRTTAYLYIDQLINKGLVLKVVQGSAKLISAEDPKNLQSLVDQKVLHAEEVKQGFPDILKEITETLPQTADNMEAEIRYYKGKNGVKKIYDEALNAKELLTYVNIEDIGNLFPENLNIFDQAFERNKDLKLFELIEDSEASHKLVSVLTQNKHYSFKFLPKEVKTSASDILIYDGKVAIINVRGSITGVIFNNLDYFNISRELFKHMWRTLPSFDPSKEPKGEEVV